MSDKVYDVDFQEIDKKNSSENDRNIRGKKLYYSTSQVADLLGETDSKIRYYASVFQGILKIETINKQRRFTEQNIEQLKFITELKNEGMTLKQIQEYCEEVDFDTEKGVQVRESNPLSIQTLAKALMEEQQKQMTIFKQELMEKVSMELKIQIETIKDNSDLSHEKIRQEVALTVDELLSDKVTTELNDFKSYINKKEEERLLSQQKKYEDLTNMFTNTMTGLITDIKNDNEEVKEFIRTTTRVKKRKQKKDAKWWNKLFNKNND